jgi:hypothetical protein
VDASLTVIDAAIIRIDSSITYIFDNFVDASLTFLYN